VNNYQGTFRKLIAWQAAKKLTQEVYRLANRFPPDEMYGLTSQMKRASISIMSNLAEGNQRTGPKDILQFFNIAFSSLTELDCQSEVAFDLGYIKHDQYQALVELINKAAFLIFRLIESKKHPNSRNSLQSLKSPNSGFSLVELLVVVSIVAILSVSSVIGFGYLGNSLRAKEAAGFISDIVKQEELKILRGDFNKAVVHFLPDYLVIEEWQSNATESLSLNPATCNAPPDNHIEYPIKISQTGNLTKKDGEGVVLEVRPVADTDPPICAPFANALETEWSYQLASGDQLSAALRFIHFNLQRDNSQGKLSILSNAGAVAEIRAPYGRKSFYKADGSSADALTLDVGDINVRESVTLH
jgi:four helix bundle protein